MTNKIVTGIVLVALSISTPFAQSIDEKRMERDLKIAENILSTLSRSDSRIRFYDNVESNYMPGYGVIFSMPKVRFVYATEGTVVYAGQSSGTGSYIIADADDDDDEEDEIAEAKRTLEEKRKEQAEEAEKELREQMTAFLVDYADLIGQLKPTDRIIVQARANNNRLFYNGRRSVNNENGFSAQIMKSDLIAYKSGKMDREAATKKVIFTSDENGEISKDLELFATIFTRLYERDLSSTYYISSRTMGYTSLDGFGVTFNMKVYSSTSDNGLHTIQTTGEGGLTQAERNEKVNAMYPEFEKTFKENLLDYGRTIKSLESDEMLVINVKLTECRNCEMPKEIDVSVKAKTLQAYDKGSISRDEAVKQVTVKRK